MRLCEDPDFQVAITNTALSRQMEEAIVEKDYYVTEALRIVAAKYGDRIVFKGGTSLSKGWDLIRRLSEDVDLLVDQSKFEPSLSNSQVPKELKRMRDLVGEHPGLELAESAGHARGTVRSETFTYESNFGGNLASTVILEPGFLPGGHPTQTRQIQSIVGKYLTEQGSAEVDDINPFEVQCLHFTRTFVEKMFLVHALVERYREHGTPLGRDARHYYDLYTLASQAEVREMLHNGGCEAIKADCAEISATRYSDDFNAPDDLNFRDSMALFPSGEIAEAIASEYERECRPLCFGPISDFDVVLEKFNEIRPWL